MIKIPKIKIGGYLTTSFFLASVGIAHGQFIDKVYVGYNTFNEVYAGVQFPKKSLNKFTFETGYQFTLKNEAHYTWGFFNLPNPFLTNYAEGIRLRAGYQFSAERHAFAGLQFEYQNLQSIKLINDEGSSYNGSSRFPTPYSEFTEHYTKYGIRLTNGESILKSKYVYFIVAPAVFYMDVHRQYSTEGSFTQRMPSNREDDFHKFTVQITFGLRIYLDVTKD